MGKDNGVFSYSLSSEFELELASLYVLTRKSNGFGIEIEYAVVKDYCLENDCDVLEVYKLLKNVNQRVLN
jgi:hypothetical protein